MKYEEFRKSAERHLETCQKLLEVLEDSSLSSEPKSQERIKKNILYIGGYVIETTLKYSIFKKTPTSIWNPVNEVETHPNWKSGRTIIRVHNFNSLKEALHVITGLAPPSSVFLWDTSSVTGMAMLGWQPDWRYEISLHWDTLDLKALVKDLEEFKKELIK